MTPRITVAGGGAVGLSLACAVPDCEVHVLEAAPRRESLPGEAYEARILALSPGTRAFLRDIGAWERLDARRIAAIRRMEVHGDGGAHLNFAARPGAALAWVLEAGRLADALETQAASLGQVTISHGARVAEAGVIDATAWAQLADGSRIEADLLVGADGPDSPLRSALGIAFEERPYGETALVANFDTEKPPGDTARQWFRADGVLAWLPLPGSRISIVWSAPNAVARELEALDARAFERRVRDAGESVLGDFVLASPVKAFPLRMVRVAQPVVSRVALVGDAAHAIHPLAGQGINLGFQDVRVLAEAIAGRSPLEAPGDLQVLRRYARARSEDVTAMQFVTDGLDRLFSTGKPGAFTLRNTGMGLVEGQEWAKAALVRRAMR